MSMKGCIRLNPSLAVGTTCVSMPQGFPGTVKQRQIPVIFSALPTLMRRTGQCTSVVFLSTLQKIVLSYLYL